MLPFSPGFLAAPLGGGPAEEGHVEHIGLAGIDDAGLRFAQLRRDEVSLDGVGVDAVVIFARLRRISQPRVWRSVSLSR